MPTWSESGATGTHAQLHRRVKEEVDARPVDGHLVGAENEYERSGRWTARGQGIGKVVATCRQGGDDADVAIAGLP